MNKRKKKLLPRVYYWNRPTPAVPRVKRLMSFLQYASDTNKAYAERPVYYRPGLPLHCEGGYGYNHDLRFLVNRGYLKMVRIPYTKSYGYNYDLKRTYLVITDKGQMAVDRGKI